MASICFIEYGPQVPGELFSGEIYMQADIPDNVHQNWQRKINQKYEEDPYEITKIRHNQ